MIITATIRAERHIMRAAGTVAAKAAKALRRAGYVVTCTPDYLSNSALATCARGYDVACNTEEQRARIESDDAEQAAAKAKPAPHVSAKQSKAIQNKAFAIMRALGL